MVPTTRSSLELMLDKLQQLDDPPKVDAPPALPVRPVSRARLPLSRRPLQLDDPRRKNLKENNIELLENSSKDDTTAEKGISNIQKCYRGYRVRCYYEELRRGVIALQSFIRGENARKGCYNRKVRKLNAIVLIQRQTRKCFEGRVLEEQQAKSRNLGLGEDKKLVCLFQQDCDRVQCSVLIDLQRRVLKREAKVRRANEENVDLKMQIQEMEEKWKEYEERMESLEKTWQDELTNMQECLSLANKNRSSEISFVQSDSARHCPELSSNSYYSKLHQQELVHVHKEFIKRDDSLDYSEELLNLKLRFKAWKKEYKNKLRETRSSLKKLRNPNTAKSRKSWWG